MNGAWAFVAAMLIVMPAVADECDAMAARAVAVTRGEFVRRLSEHSAILRSSGGVILLDCRAPSVSMGEETAFPGDGFFRTLAAVGSSIAKADARDIERDIRLCQEASLRQDGHVGVNRRTFTVDCLFVRDTSSFVLILPRR